MQLFLSNYHNNGLKRNSTPLRLCPSHFCQQPFLTPGFALYPLSYRCIFRVEGSTHTHPHCLPWTYSPPSIYDNKWSLSFIHSLSMLIISYNTEHRFSLSFGHCPWIFHISVWSLGNHTRISQTQRHTEKKQHSLPAFLNPHTIRLLSYPFQSLKTNSNSSLASTLLKCLPH